MNTLLKNKLFLGFGAIIVVLLGVIALLVTGGNKSDNPGSATGSHSSATKTTITPKDVVNSKTGVILYSIDASMDEWDADTSFKSLYYFKKGHVTKYDWSVLVGDSVEAIKIKDIVGKSNKEVLAMAKSATEKAYANSKEAATTPYLNKLLKEQKILTGTYAVKIAGIYNNGDDSQYYGERIRAPKRYQALKEDPDLAKRFNRDQVIALYDTWRYSSVDGSQFKGWRADTDSSSDYTYVMQIPNNKAIYTGLNSRPTKGIEDLHIVRDND